MKKYIHHTRVDLLAGLLSCNLLSACVDTRPTLGMHSQQKDNLTEGSFPLGSDINAMDAIGLTRLDVCSNI